MALLAALRRAAASSAPLLRSAAAAASSAPLLRSAAAARVGGRCAGALIRPVAVAAAQMIAHFSTSEITQASNTGSRSELLTILDDEIKCALELDDDDNKVEFPENFPFEVLDDEGMNIVRLKRDFQNEKIEVIVSMPSLITGDYPEDDDNKQDDANEDEDGQALPTQPPTIPLTVTISKTSRPSLVFGCTAYPDEVVIDSLSVSEKKGDEEDEMLAYEGPEFFDLDENLKRSFLKYLEVRGISPVTTNFLHEYMVTKDNREYVRWLGNLKSFIQQ